LIKVRKSLNYVDVEKGLPNQTNYISECYPSIPLSGASVSQYQKEMYEIANRKKKSFQMMQNNAFHNKKPSEKPSKSHRRHKSYNRQTRRHDVRRGLQGQFDRADHSEIIEKPRKHHKRHERKNGNFQGYDINTDN
jgi:hypothetical protein